jgi:N-acetylmuramoyl-L-alanine amidase
MFTRKGQRVRNPVRGGTRSRTVADNGRGSGVGRRAALLTGAALVVGGGIALYESLPGHGGRPQKRRKLPPRHEGDVDYPGAQWVPAASTNYRLAERPYDFPIDTVVIHVVQGSCASALRVFQQKGPQASAHYVLRKDGHISQAVRERDVAFQTGNRDYNDRSVGMEHEGFVSQGSFAEAMYRSSARLTADICRRYAIPVDRKHIIGHYQVPGQDHTDPGKHWDWTHYMRLVRQASAASPTSS